MYRDHNPWAIVSAQTERAQRPHKKHNTRDIGHRGCAHHVSRMRTVRREIHAVRCWYLVCLLVCDALYKTSSPEQTTDLIGYL